MIRRGHIIFGFTDDIKPYIFCRRYTHGETGFFHLCTLQHSALRRGHVTPVTADRNHNQDALGLDKIKT